MAVNDVSNVENVRVLDTKSRTINNDLGKDAFLKILTAQMANQDPLQPTSDTEFIAQMAQFSALEQMQNMNSSMSAQYAYNLIGADVMANRVLDADGNMFAAEIFGQVLGITKMNDVEYLQVYDYATKTEVLTSLSAITNTFEGVTTRDQLQCFYRHFASYALAHRIHLF
jgi:flagellar basal-body rod modification protein FlgD